jgi:tRNA(Arg) A34 adenosine deaminase TadA
MSRHTVTARVYSRKGTLISTATNSYTKTHPLMLYFGKRVGINYKVFLHAELAALLKCGTTTPYKLVVERFTKDGRPALAKPCSICEQAIKAWGVRRVEYTI